METKEIINQTILESEMYSDFEEHIVEIVLDRVNKLDSELKGKYLYFFRITKKPDRTNYHTFDVTKLNDISRRLINGMVSLGTIPNRKFWNRYFEGGIRSTSIVQEEPDDFPSFNLNYILYSSYDNLDVRILSQLSTRVRMIDPTLNIKLEYIGVHEISLLRTYIECTTKVELNSKPIEKLGQKNFNHIVLNPIQRPIFIGNLFKPYKCLLNKPLDVN